MPEDLEDEESEPQNETADEQEVFLLPYGADGLIDSAIRLGKKLLKLPRCSQDERATLEKAICALRQLPKVTPELAVEYGFSYRDSTDDLHYWSVYFDETELKWSAGGSVYGPAGGDSYTSFQFSLLRGGEDSPIGSRSSWLDWEYDFDQATSIEANDYNPEPDKPDAAAPEAPEVVPVVRYQFDSESQSWRVVDEFQQGLKAFPRLPDPIACLRFGKLKFSTYDDYSGTEVECPNCGKINVLKEDAGEYDSSGLLVGCAGCPCCIAFVQWPTRDEAEAAGDRAQIQMFDIMTTRQQRFDQGCLKSPDQLPEIRDDAFTLEWALEKGNRFNKDEVYTVIKHRGKTIFRELALWEGGFRYRRVADILKKKYGSHLTDVIPTLGGWLYLGGDSFVARWDAEQARKDLFGKEDERA
jgi:ssDNA-binding Zn-finger/Zn-ribbon topoisomerase 1